MSLWNSLFGNGKEKSLEEFTNYASLSDRKKVEIARSNAKIIDPKAFALSNGNYIFFCGFEKGNRVIDNSDLPDHGRAFDEPLNWMGEPIKKEQCIAGNLYGRLERQALFGETGEKLDARAALAGEYKIHLMPRAQYIPAVTKRLCEMMKKDPHFRDSIDTFKIKVHPNPSKIIHDGDILTWEETLPIVVIYTQWGKEKAQQALDRIWANFGEFDDQKIGLGQTPRHNQRINDLIYYAQSGGDLKRRYLEMKSGGENTLLGKSLIHFKGDEHELLDPSIGDAPTVEDILDHPAIHIASETEMITIENSVDLPNQDNDLDLLREVYSILANPKSLEYYPHVEKARGSLAGLIRKNAHEFSPKAQELAHYLLVSGEVSLACEVGRALQEVYPENKKHPFHAYGNRIFLECGLREAAAISTELIEQQIEIYETVRPHFGYAKKVLMDDNALREKTEQITNNIHHQAHITKQRKEKAELYELAGRVNPHDDYSLYRAARNYQQAADQHPQEAKELLTKALWIYTEIQNLQPNSIKRISEVEKSLKTLRGP